MAQRTSSLPPGKVVLAAFQAIKNDEPEAHLISLPDLPYYLKYWDPPSSFTPAPPTMEGWERRHDLSPNTNALIADIQPKFSKRIASVKMLGHGIFHMVYILMLEDGKELVARIAFNFRTDPNSLAWTRLKMQRELAVLRLLTRAASNIPVPKVIYSDPRHDNAVGSPYMIMERLPGVGLGKGCDALLTSMNDQDKFVQSLAQAMVDVYRITLTKIGSVLEVPAIGELIIGPLLDLGETDHAIAEGPFNEIEEYLDSIITTASVRNILAARGGAADPSLDLDDLLRRLRHLASLLVPKDDPDLMRIALVHTDTNADNFLINGKELSGLIDWETHAALPACLAARFPRFLRCDGMWDPRYASDQEMTKYPQDWPATEGEAEHLRAVFRNTALGICPEFAKALDKGEKLRQLVEWTQWADWEGDVTWKGCDLWEKDVRLSLGVQGGL